MCLQLGNGLTLNFETSIILGDPVVSKASPLHCQAILLWNSVFSHFNCESRQQEGPVSGFGSI